MPKLIVFLSILMFLFDLGSDGRVGKPGFSQPEELGIYHLTDHDHNSLNKWGNHFSKIDKIFRIFLTKITIHQEFPKILRGFQFSDFCQIDKPPPLFS